MKTSNLKDARKGWFAGNYEQAFHKCEGAEVAVKHNKAGDLMPAHTHRIVTETMAVVTGRVRINDRIFTAGDLIMVEPGEVAEYEWLEDSITVLFKTPSAPEDKVFV
jgi:quercetin dioxygenase-like cupin family protein